MKRLFATLTEIWQTPAGNAGKLHIPELKQVDPGQYFQVWRKGEIDLIPEIVYSTSLAHNGYIDFDRFPVQFYPGDRVVLWGPLGHGFSIPPRSKLLYLVSSKPDISRLKPVAELAIAKGLPVSLIVNGFDLQYWHKDLPAAIEIQAFSDLSNIVSHPGYVVTEIDATHDLDVSEKIKEEIPEALLKHQGQVLIYTAMPCIGMAECGVCAIKTKKGWRFTCKDGPVFLLKDLFDVAI